MLINEKKINPNIDALRMHFENKLSRYFTKTGKPQKQYFEYVRCYNCGSNACDTEFMAGYFRHVRCSRCGMMYANPRFKERISHDLYNEDDYTKYFKIKLIPSLSYRKNILAARKYAQVSGYFKKPGRVLDIGCGLGEVLSVFKEHGWDCTGIEFNKFAADYASDKFGLKIINKSIFDIDCSAGEKFDVVMLWGVLEHFYNPRKILRMVRNILSNDGILVLEVPSADSVLVRMAEATSMSVDRIIEGDRHIMLFSLKAFRQMTGDCGFSAVKIVSNGLDIATINRLSLNGRLALKNVNDVQEILDKSYQGDILRGFFKKIKKI